MYCIYTDQDVPTSRGSWDHVVPLALGGRNEFVVWSENYANSTIGSKVDAPITKDFVVEMALHKTGIRGHRNKRHEPRWRKVSIDENPIQVTWARDRIKAWDPIGRRDLRHEDVAGKEMTAKFQIIPTEIHRFLAKVALGGGYFIYESDISDTFDCDLLRSMIFSDAREMRNNEQLMNSEIRISDRFHPDSTCPSSGGIFRALCESIGRTILIVVPENERMSFHVGVAGVFLGSIIVPAKTADLPIDGVHDLGHCIILEPGKTERCSFRALCGEFLEESGVFS